MICYVVLFTAITATSKTAYSSEAGSPGITISQRQSQTVLLLNVAKHKRGKYREKRFAQELRMSLDDLIVREVDTPEQNFGELVLGRQIASVRPLLGREDAAAAIWLIEDSTGILLLYVVAVSSGRALVRLIETDLKQVSHAELAASARELLGTVYLFDLSSENRQSPVGQAVNMVIDQVAPDKKRTKWSIPLNITSTGGVMGQKGPSIRLGGNTGLEWNLVDGLEARVLLGGSGGPLDSAPGVEAHEWALSVTLGAVHLWKIGPVALGPAIAFRSLWSNLSLRTGEGPKKEFSEWQFPISLCLEFRWMVTPRLDLVFDGGVSAMPKRDTYHRVSDNSLAYATPFLNWDFSLGVIFHLY